MMDHVVPLFYVNDDLYFVMIVRVAAAAAAAVEHHCSWDDFDSYPVISPYCCYLFQQ